MSYDRIETVFKNEKNYNNFIDDMEYIYSIKEENPLCNINFNEPNGFYSKIKKIYTSLEVIKEQRYIYSIGELDLQTLIITIQVEINNMVNVDLTKKKESKLKKLVNKLKEKL